MAMTNEELEELVTAQKSELERLKSKMDDLSKQLSQPRMKVKVGTINWCAFAVSVVALILGIIAVCKKYSRISYIDYWGVIIGILGLLVTVLIGFQIFQIVRFDKEKDNFSADVNTHFTSENSKIDDIRNEVGKSKDKISSDIKKHDEYVAALLALIMDMYAKIGGVNDKIKVNYYYEVVDFGLLSILRFSNVENYKQCNICLGLLLQYIPDFSVVHCSEKNHNHLMNFFNKINKPSKLKEYEKLRKNMYCIQIEDRVKDE